MCTKLFWSAIYCANTRPKTNYQSISILPLGTGYKRSTDHTWVQYYDRNYDRAVNPDMQVQNRFFHFSAISLLTFVNKIIPYFPSIPLIEISNGEKFYVAWGNDYRNCPSFYFYHLDRRVFIGYFLWVSKSESSSLTSMMASYRLYHRPWMRTSPLVSIPHLPWNTYYFWSATSLSD